MESDDSIDDTDPLFGALEVELSESSTSSSDEAVMEEASSAVAADVNLPQLPPQATALRPAVRLRRNGSNENACGKSNDNAAVISALTVDARPWSASSLDPPAPREANDASLPSLQMSETRPALKSASVDETLGDYCLCSARANDGVRTDQPITARPLAGELGTAPVLPFLSRFVWS